jgi:hypothetical protein
MSTVRQLYVPERRKNEEAMRQGHILQVTAVVGKFGTDG